MPKVFSLTMFLIWKHTLSLSLSICVYLCVLSFLFLLPLSLTWPPPFHSFPKPSLFCHPTEISQVSLPHFPQAPQLLASGRIHSFWTDLLKGTPASLPLNSHQSTEWQVEASWDFFTGQEAKPPSPSLPLVTLGCCNAAQEAGGAVGPPVRKGDSLLSNWESKEKFTIGQQVTLLLETADLLKRNPPLAESCTALAGGSLMSSDWSLWWTWHSLNVGLSTYLPPPQRSSPHCPPPTSREGIFLPKR